MPNFALNEEVKVVVCAAIILIPLKEMIEYTVTRNYKIYFKQVAPITMKSILPTRMRE